MGDDNEVKMSRLSKSISQDGKTVRVDIYKDGAGGWTLEVEDEFLSLMVYEDSFSTHEEALKKVLDTIDKEGIDYYIETETASLH